MVNTKKVFVIILIIIAIASFFRFYKITSIPPGLYPDEAMNGNNAFESISKGEYKLFYPENNGREGLFINIQAFFLKNFLRFYNSQEPWMLRFPSALFGIITVMGVYFLSKELFRNNKKPEIIALVSSFFIATSFWHINFSRIGFRAIMAPCFLVWGIYFLILSSRKNEEFKIPNLKFKILIPIFAGIIYGLGMHSYIAYRATPIIILFILFLFLFKYGAKQTIKIGLLFLLGSIVVSIPLIFYFTQNPQDFLGRTSQVSIFNSEKPLVSLGLNIFKTLQMFFINGDENWRHNISGQAELFWPVALCFILGIISGIKKIFYFKKEKTESFGFFILLVWLITVSLPVIISSEGIPHALRSILMIPAVMIISGYGCVFMFEFLKSKNASLKLIYSLCLITFLVIILNSFWTYFVFWGENKNTKDAFSNDYLITGKLINSFPKEMPKYVVVEASGVEVRGIPMPTQTVMFITDTFTKEKQKEKNIHYVTNKEKIPDGSAVFYIK